MSLFALFLASACGPPDSPDLPDGGIVDPNDTTAPTVVSSSPAHNATGVAIGATINVTFSEALAPASISAATFTLKQGTQDIAGIVTYQGTTATFTPSAPLAMSTLYTATITTGVTDLAGNALATSHVFSFATVAPPVLGNAQWGKSVTTGPNGSQFYAVVAGSDGVYAAGYITGNGMYSFGNSVTTMGNHNGRNVVLVKYDTAGVAQWARSVTTGAHDSQFYALAVGSDGSVYAAGSMGGGGTFTFGNSVTSTVPNPATIDNFVLVKYDASGAAQWASKLITANNNSQYKGVAVGSDGVYVVGSMNGTTTFNFGDSVTARGVAQTNILLVKYNLSGAPQWAKTVTAATAESAYNGVALSSDGVFAAGYIHNTSTHSFGNSIDATGTALGPNPNLVLVKYDLSGTPQWARSVTAGSSSSEWYSLALGNDGSLYAAGYATGNGAYQLGNSVSASPVNGGFNYSVLLAKYDASGTAQWARTTSSGNNDSRFYSVSMSGDEIYAAGYVRGTSMYSFGNSKSVTAPSINDNPLLVKYDPSGTAQFARTVTASPSGNGYSIFRGVAAGIGAVYAAGNIDNTGTFNFGNSVTATGTSVFQNIVLIKYQ